MREQKKCYYFVSKLFKSFLILILFQNASMDFQFTNSEYESSVVNTEDGRKSCTLCGMTFSTLSNAQRHFRNQHTNTERIPCNLCQRTFKNSHSHNEHLRINHGITQSMLKAQPLIAETTS